jgi:hypothetical protein
MYELVSCYAYLHQRRGITAIRGVPVQWISLFAGHCYLNKVRFPDVNGVAREDFGWYAELLRHDQCQ